MVSRKISCVVCLLMFTVITSLMFNELTVTAQSSNSCPEVSPKKVLPFTTTILLSSTQTNPAGNYPFIVNPLPPGSGQPFGSLPAGLALVNSVPQSFSVQLNPVFQSQLNAACTNKLSSFAATPEYAQAATECMKECARSNSPTLQCAGTASLVCSHDTTPQKIKCNNILSIGPVGSPPAVACTVDGQITMRCACDSLPSGGGN
jgi:hypothetical protein